MEKKRREPEDLENDEVAIECTCGRTVEMSSLPEYEMPTFVGHCACGRVWSLTDISRQARQSEPDTDE